MHKSQWGSTYKQKLGLISRFAKMNGNQFRSYHQGLKEFKDK